MNEAVARRLREIARQVQAEHPVSAIDRAGMLAPLTLFLAEFHYLGYTRKVMHEFAKRAGVEISYQRLCVWVLNQFGDQPKEAIGELLQIAVDQGEFESPYFQRRQKPEKPVYQEGEGRAARRSNHGSGAEVQEFRGRETLPASLRHIPMDEEATAEAPEEVSRPRNSEIVPIPAEEVSRPRNSIEPTEEPASGDDEAEKRKQARLRALADSFQEFKSPYSDLGTNQSTKGNE